jgi:hypothetical protein
MSLFLCVKGIEKNVLLDLLYHLCVFLHVYMCVCVCVCVCVYVCVCWGSKFRAWCMLSMCSTPELGPAPFAFL